jgi:tetratricopeptide (TPR) repeat protein
LDLSPLDTVLSLELANALLQRLADASTSLNAMVTAGAEGNPFYMEELVKMLVDDGVIDAHGDTWRVVPDKLLRAHVPSTLAGVLQARLDALTLRERTALQQAAVVGHVFWEPALAAIDPAAVEMLPTLLGKRMIVRLDSAEGDEGHEYAFQHNLLHQATYDGVLKAPRLDAHAKVGRYWRARAEVVSARDVTAASSRALAETQYHLCKVDAPSYLAWFGPQFDIYLHAYAGTALRPLMEQLVEVCEQRFGPDHPETAKALTNSARALLLLGAGAEAERSLQRALQIQQTTPGDHPDKARTLAVMGGYHSGRGDLESAEPYFRQALGMRTATLGAEHPLTLDTLDYLAKVLLELDQLDEAERMFRRVLVAKERLFGAVSPDTAFAQTALGEVLYKLGRGAEAEALIRRALDVQRIQLGADNPETAMSMQHLSECLRRINRLEEAAQLASDALAVFESRLGQEHEWTAWGMLSLAKTRFAEDRPDDASALSRRAVAVFETVYGPTHPVLGTTLLLTGRALLRLARPAEARQCLARAQEILTAAGPRSADDARTASELLQAANDLQVGA